jgi:hypothetical protein
LSWRNKLLSWALTAALLCVLPAAGLWAQEEAPPPAAQEQEQEQPPAPPRWERGPQRRHRGPGWGMHRLLLRVAELPPEQQQQALESDEAFQRMPPPMQEQLRQRLQELNQLPPEQRQEELERLRRGEGRGPLHELFLRVAPLTPEEQERALAEDEFFQSLPPDAQERFRRHLQRFDQKPPEARERSLRRFRRFADLTPEQQESVSRR